MVVLVVCSVYGSAMIIQDFRYDKKFCNCEDMSFELAGFLKGLGIKSQVVYGFNKSCFSYNPDGSRYNVGHYWVRIPGVCDVESTNLFLMMDHRWKASRVVDV